jgi:hypothetical protein
MYAKLLEGKSEKVHERNKEDNRSITRILSRSQWPRGLRRESAAARSLGLRVRISAGAGMSLSCGCCVLSGRGHCVGLITCQEESYQVCVSFGVIRCKNNPLHLQRLGRTGQNKKDNININVGKIPCENLRCIQLIQG